MSEAPMMWLAGALGVVLMLGGFVIGWRLVHRQARVSAQSAVALVALSSRRDGLVGVLRAALELDPTQPAIINDLQEHRCVVANLAFHSALSCRPGDLNGALYLPHIHPDDLKRTSGAADDVPLMDPSARFINRWRTADGRWAVLEWRHGHYADESGYGLSLADVVGYEGGNG